MSSQNNNKLYTTPQARVNTVLGDDGNWWDMLRKAELDYRATGGEKSNFQFWIT